jgi:hypothetical protein
MLSIGVEYHGVPRRHLREKFLSSNPPDRRNLHRSPRNHFFATNSQVIEHIPIQLSADRIFTGGEEASAAWAFYDEGCGQKSYSDDVS